MLQFFLFALFAICFGQGNLGNQGLGYGVQGNPGTFGTNQGSQGSQRIPVNEGNPSFGQGNQGAYGQGNQGIGSHRVPINQGNPSFGQGNQELPYEQGNQGMMGNQGNPSFGQGNQGAYGQGNQGMMGNQGNPSFGQGKQELPEQGKQGVMGNQGNQTRGFKVDVKDICSRKGFRHFFTGTGDEILARWNEIISPTSRITLNGNEFLTGRNDIAQLSQRFFSSLSFLSTVVETAITKEGARMCSVVALVSLLPKGKQCLVSGITDVRITWDPQGKLTLLDLLYHADPKVLTCFPQLSLIEQPQGGQMNPNQGKTSSQLGNQQQRPNTWSLNPQTP